MYCCNTAKFMESISEDNVPIASQIKQEILSLGLTTRPDTNRAAKPQKMARGLIFRI